VSSVDTSKSGRFVFAGYDDGFMRVWDTLLGGSWLHEYNCHGRVTCVEVSPNGKALATCGWDQLVRVSRPLFIAVPCLCLSSCYCTFLSTGLCLESCINVKPPSPVPPSATSADPSTETGPSWWLRQILPYFVLALKLEWFFISTYQ